MQRPYGSQCETPHDRSLRKVRTIRTRLGVSHSLLEHINAWHKPKGMHWRTFPWLRLADNTWNQVLLKNPPCSDYFQK